MRGFVRDWVKHGVGYWAVEFEIKGVGIAGVWPQRQVRWHRASASARDGLSNATASPNLKAACPGPGLGSTTRCQVWEPGERTAHISVVGVPGSGLPLT